jgi:hypothetical protein
VANIVLAALCGFQHMLADIRLPQGTQLGTTLDEF